MRVRKLSTKEGVVHHKSGECLAMAEYSSSRRTLALRMILLGEAGAGKTCLYHWIKYKVSTLYYSILQRLCLW